MTDASPFVTVIVPTWNEESALGRCLASLATTAERAEVIVSDGGSDDGTLAVAQSFDGVRVVDASRPQRAVQMNDAARVARGRVLWFVHADSVVVPGSFAAIRRALDPASVVGGSFRFAVEAPGLRYRLLEHAVSARTRWLRSPYGDQGLFVRRRIFDEIGGFPAQPILEDLHFVRSMRRIGRIVALDERLITSARRWESRGFWPTTFRHAWILALDRLGVSPSRIAKRVHR